MYEQAESGYFGPFGYYGGGGCIINLVLGFVAASIISKKGHGRYQFWMHLIGGVVFCGPGALVSAIAAEDLTLKKKVEALESAAMQTRQRGRAVSQQVRCTRCGSMNAAELVACWHCELELEQLPPAVEPPAPAVKLPNSTRTKLREVSVRPAWWGPEPAKRVKPQPSKPTTPPPAIERPPTELPTEIRIECSACKKRFSGAETKLKRIAKCPKCGATPFEFSILPAK